MFGERIIRPASLHHLETFLGRGGLMGNKDLRCFAGEQGTPYSKAPAVQYSLTMRVMVVKTALVFMILFTLALSCEGLIMQSAGATDGAESLQDQEAKAAPVRRRNRAHTILLSSRIRLAGASQAGNDGEETPKSSLLKASERQQLRKMLTRRLQDVSDGNCNAVTVATRFRSAQFRRKMGPTDGTARQRIPLTSRPVKALFILCAKKKPGVRDLALTSSSRAAPTNVQRYIPFGNHHRRALMQLPPLPVPPLPFAPASPRFRFPPLPFAPAFPQSRLPPRPITLPEAPPLLFTPIVPPPPKSLSLIFPPLPPFPFTNIPPLPFQLPPIPCVPSSSANSLPPP